MKRCCLAVILSMMLSAPAAAIEMFTHFGNGDYNHDETVGTPWMGYADFSPCPPKAKRWGRSYKRPAPYNPWAIQ